MTNTTAMQSVESIVVEIISNEAGRPAALYESLVDDLGLDSLAVMAVALAIEERFNLPAIDDGEVARMSRVLDVVHYVRSHMPGDPASA